jgi:hypothetical protein
VQRVRALAVAADHADAGARGGRAALRHNGVVHVPRSSTQELLVKRPRSGKGRSRARSLARLAPLALALVLAACLLGAQFAGHAHRIAHPQVALGVGPALGEASHAALSRASGSEASAQGALAADAPGHDHDQGHAHDQGHVHAAWPFGHGDAGHDCAAYDAATLGDGPPLALAASAVLPPRVARHACGDRAAPAVPPRLAFRSRAPPRA